MTVWAIMALAACGGGGCTDRSVEAAHLQVPNGENVSVAEERGAAEPVPDLPFSQGRTFASLDDYLAFLEERGRYDVPWYREIRPGVYELVSRRGPGAEPRLYTREELERRFGFER